MSGVHVYLYANGDPVGMLDLSGHEGLAEIMMAVGVSGLLDNMAIPSIPKAKGAQPTSDITVYIWNPQGATDSWGHASLTLSDNTHISWWPNAPRAMHYPTLSQYFSVLKNLYSAPANDPQYYIDDLRGEKRPPSREITIRCLDEAKIKTWWASFKTSHVWSTLDQNCSTTASDALKAGGAGASGANSVLGFALLTWASHHYAWRPNDVETFADDINKYQGR